MAAADIVLSVHDLSKKYSVDKRGQAGGKKSQSDFWALKGVSFEAKRGEVLGIIGKNGAGKSTLLKIISEIIPPTMGSIEYNGTVLPILEIGTGFHPELSGYDNIFFNASLLGIKKKEIEPKVNDIVNFSGIREFIHEPVKSYSSGMYLRLALSIALFTDYEILLLDEVISVGDAEFRLKAVQRIKELAAAGKTCIMISHDLHSVLSLCDRCILLENGAISHYSKPKTVVDDYVKTIYEQRKKDTVSVTEHLACKFIQLEFNRAEFFISEKIDLKITFEKRRSEDIDVVLRVRNHLGLVMSDCEIYRPEYVPRNLPPGIYEVTCSIPANLFDAGTYFVDLIFGDKESALLDIQLAGTFLVKVDEWERSKKWNTGNENIPFRPQCTWQTVKVD